MYASGTVVASRVAAPGSALPLERTVVVGAVISVSDWVVLLG